MKKLIAILMCVAVLISLTACGGKNPEGNADVSGSTNQATETTKPVKKKVSRGTIDGDVYTNNFVGFTFTKPAEWNYLSDDEIAQTINTGQDVMNLNTFEEALNKTASIYDMYAVDAYGNAVMVCYENTMLTAFREVTLDEYVEGFKSQTQKADYSYKFLSSEDVTLGGTTFKKLISTVTVNDIEITQATYITVIDQYAVSIILTTAIEDGIESMEAMFNW